MRKKFYYYKTDEGDFVFQDGQVFTDDREAIKYIAEKRRRGFLTWRLYMYIPEEAEMIARIFTSNNNTK